jgi:glucuronoarabinoxylan endo-1,4-beta-xylanase
MRTLSSLVVVGALSATLVACGSKSHDVTMNWSDTRQTIEGFGASSAFFGANLTNAQADQLFDPKKGIGLSLLRTMIGVPADTASGVEPSDGTANPVPTAPELTTAQQASIRGCQVWAAAWTPPPIWKTTNNTKGSEKDDAGTDFAMNRLQPEHYQDFANYLAQYVDLLAAASPPVKVVGVSPANEPDYVATWDGAQWTPDELTSFIGQYMGPTFMSKYGTSVKVMAPETANCPSCDKYIPPILNDSAAKNAVGIMATHNYGPVIGNYDKPRNAGKSFWQTEMSQENAKGDTPDPSMASALFMAQRMHSDLVTTEMNAWHWWAIYITEDGLNDNTRLNPALMQPDASKGDPYMFKRGWAMGNWSKFVRPGFKRLNASDNPNNGVFTEAYRDDTHLAIIAINTNTSAVNQKFIVNGNAVSALTPWVTDPNNNLIAQSAVTLANGQFTFDLPAQSVVTFVNWDATTETPGLVVTPQPDGGTHIGTCEPDCAGAPPPDNMGNGGVTDFSDWNSSTLKWGDPQGLFGYIFGYAGPSSNASMMSATADATKKYLHAVGSVAMGGYGGIGMSFCSCRTVAAFTQVQFSVAGSWPGCDLELQIKTFDQTPKSGTPPGGCDSTAGSCYSYPVASKVAVPMSAPQTVAVPLSSFSNWSATQAAQVVGLQWQWTYSGSNIPADGGVDASAACPVDATVTNIKFLP